MEHRDIKKLQYSGSRDCNGTANEHDLKIIAEAFNDHTEALKELAEQIDILEKEIEELKEAHNAN